MEQTFPAQIKKATSSDNRLRVGTMNADGSVAIQGTDVAVGHAGGAGPGQPVAVLRQDKTWVNLGMTSTGPTWQSGENTVSVSAAASATLAVLFAVPFEVRPTVVCNFENGAGATAGWGVRAINVATTGFTIFIFGTASTFSTNIMWQAMLKTQ